MRTKSSNNFNAALAFEKLYQTKGVEEDAFYFNLIEEELKESERHSFEAVRTFFYRKVYRIVTVVWFSLYFVGANIGRLVK